MGTLVLEDLEGNDVYGGDRQHHEEASLEASAALGASGKTQALQVLNEQERNDLALFERLNALVVKDRSRFVELLGRGDYDKSGTVSIEHMRKAFSFIGADLRPPEAYRLQLRLDPGKTGGIDIRRILSVLKEPREYILALRQQVSKGSDSAREKRETKLSPEKLLSQMSLSDLRSEAPPSDRSRTDVVGFHDNYLPKKLKEEFDDMFDFPMDVKVMQFLASKLDLIAKEYPRILYFLRAQPDDRVTARAKAKFGEPVCNGSQLRDALASLGFMISSADFEDIFNLMDLEGNQFIPIKAISVYAHRAAKYLRIRINETQEGMRPSVRRPDSRSSKKTSPFALHEEDAHPPKESVSRRMVRDVEHRRSVKDLLTWEETAPVPKAKESEVRPSIRRQPSAASASSSRRSAMRSSPTRSDASFAESTDRDHYEPPQIKRTTFQDQMPDRRPTRREPEPEDDVSRSGGGSVSGSGSDYDDYPSDNESYYSDEDYYYEEKAPPVQASPAAGPKLNLNLKKLNN
jgi:Ca2+-binding EF-hand superfamily protein